MEDYENTHIDYQAIKKPRNGGFFILMRANHWRTNMYH